VDLYSWFDLPWRVHLLLQENEKTKNFLKRIWCILSL